MKLLCLFAIALFPLGAADPPGFMYWSASELKGFAKTLSPKIDAKKAASQQLANFGNHVVMIAHREGSGEAELHEKMVDFMIVESGEATLAVGGKMRNAKTIGPGEMRGPSIDGGTKRKLSPGDVVHVPANTPHQLLLDPGKQFTYFVIKVESK